MHFITIIIEVNKYAKYYNEYSINSFKYSATYITLITIFSIIYIFSPGILFISFYKGMVIGFLMGSVVLTYKIKGIFYYDLAILNLKKELGLKTDLVWDSTFMVTNYKTCNYYYKKGVKYALISKEITTGEIIEIIRNTKIVPIVELISYPIVAFSKRSLVTNYYINYKLEKKDDINIIEPKSKQKYYLKENEFGTSFILDKLMNGSKILRELTNTKLDYILLKEDMIKHSIFIECIKNIEYYLKNYKTMDDNDYKNWLHKQNELLGRNTNFFYRKTIYKVK